MNDFFDFPPERELPTEARLAARNRIMAELNGPERSRPGRALVPASIAAAVVVVAAAAAGLVVVGHGTASTTASAVGKPSTSSSVQQPPSGDPAAGQVSYVTPDQLYSPTYGQAPADLTARCAAQDNDGRPAATTWQPIVTATADGVHVIAYHTPAGPLFCEVTPTTVTLSRVATGSGTVATFTTPFGSIAGLVAPKYHWLDVFPGSPANKQGVTALVHDGVFVVPNGFPVRSGTGDLQGFTGSQPLGPQDTIATPLPVATAAVTDRTVAPADQSSPGGQLLKQCLTQNGGPPVIDPAGWQPGVTVGLDAHERLQLGTQDGLLVSCVSTDQPSATQAAVELAIPNGQATGVRQSGAVPPNPYVTTGETFYGFTDVGSKTYAIVGLVRSNQVARVTLTAPGLPSIVGTVHNGTLAVPNVNAQTYDPQMSHARLVLSDASGKVLDQLPLS